VLTVVVLAAPRCVSLFPVSLADTVPVLAAVWRNTGGTRPGCTGLLLDGGAVLPGFVMPLSELFVKDEP
jgi:hypothetical protein